MQACVNTDDWLLYDRHGSEVEVEAPEDGSDARGVIAERTAEGWVVVRSFGSQEATLPCHR